MVEGLMDAIHEAPATAAGRVGALKTERMINEK
jgi:hypothetical protein